MVAAPVTLGPCMARFNPLAFLCAALVVLSPLVVAAEASTWIIEPGREALVGGLFAPHLATPPSAWRIESVAIVQDHVVCTLITDAGERAEVRLDHPDVAPAGAIRSASFALTVNSGGPTSALAAETIIEAIVANDGGDFWQARAPSALRSEAPPRRSRTLDRRDGLLWAAALAVFLALLVWRQLRQAPRAVAWSLAGITVYGAALRWLLTIDTTMGVWPYTRMTVAAGRIWDSPTLLALVERSGRTLYFSEFVGTLALVCAVATPAALYCHASQLLGGARAGLIAALLIASLPAHVRFSMSEVAFIPSIVLSSLAFALLHGALKEESRGWRWLTVAALAPTAYLVFVTRPLNIIFGALMIYTAIAFVPKSVPRSRQVLVVGSVLAAALVCFVFFLRVSYQAELGHAAHPLRLAAHSLSAIFDPRYNTILRPGMTPPALPILAAAGVGYAWRAGRRSLVVFLVGWFLLFICAHAVVLPSVPHMNARYHLHLAVPLTLLATLGLGGLWDTRTSWARAALALLAVSPLAHAHFVRDVAFNDQREYEFVRSARDGLPDQCTVLELGTTPGVPELRFERLGLRMQGGERGGRFTVVDIDGGSATEGSGDIEVGDIEGPRTEGDPLSWQARDILAAPPECLVFYQGMPCWYAKEPSAPIAPACEAVLQLGDWRLEHEARFENRVYNDPLQWGFGPDFREAHIAIYRWTGSPDAERDDRRGD